MQSIFPFVFLGPHPWHMEVPKLGVKSELQLLAYTTATATSDLSSICDLYYNLRQYWILNPLSEARDQTCILMDTSQVPNLLSHNHSSARSEPCLQPIPQLMAMPDP